MRKLSVGLMIGLLGATVATTASLAQETKPRAYTLVVSGAR